jgi:hypothetical protein
MIMNKYEEGIAYGPGVISKKLHKQIMKCKTANGYRPRFTLEVALMAFLEMPHEKRVELWKKSQGDKE